MKNKIAFVGKSGAGKDTIKNLLIEKSNLKPEVSYTTRPPREGEINGQSYFFVTEEEFHSKDMIEKVCFRGWWYGTEKEQFDNSNIFIFTPSGIKLLPEEHRNQLYIVYLHVSKEEQKKRIIKRGSYEEKELERRIIADEEDFKNFTEWHISINTDKLSPDEIVSEFFQYE